MNQLFKILLLLSSFVNHADSQACPKKNGGREYVLMFNNMGSKTSDLELSGQEITVVNFKSSLQRVQIANSPLLTTRINAGVRISNTVAENITIQENIRGQIPEDSYYQKDNKAVIVQGTSASVDNYMVFGMNYADKNCEGFQAIPATALGKYYMAFGWWPNGDGRFEIGIAAIQDGTTITLEFQNETGIELEIEGKAIGEDTVLTHDITLNKFQTARILAQQDLSGTIIEGTKQFAVFSGNDDVMVGPNFEYFGHLVEQIPPSEAWGTTFIFGVPKPVTTSPRLKILVEFENTWVNVSGQAPLLINAKGGRTDENDERFVISPGQGTIIRASDIALGGVFYQSGSFEFDEKHGVDPAFSILPPVSQYRSKYVFAPHLFEDFQTYVTLWITTSEIGSIRLNGQTPTYMDGWTKINDAKGEFDYSFNTIKINAQAYTLESISDTNFGALLLGSYYDFENGESCTYAYPVGQCYNQENTTIDLEVTLPSLPPDATQQTSKAGSGKTTGMTGSVGTTEAKTTASAGSMGSTEAKTTVSAGSMGTTEAQTTGSAGSMGSTEAKTTVSAGSMGTTEAQTTVSAGSMGTTDSQTTASMGSTASLGLTTGGTQDMTTAAVTSDTTFGITCSSSTCTNITIISQNSQYEINGFFEYVNDRHSRPYYENKVESLFLYYASDNASCGKWLIGPTLGSFTAIMVSDDKAVSPTDVKEWKIVSLDGTKFESTNAITLSCTN